MSKVVENAKAYLNNEHLSIKFDEDLRGRLTQYSDPQMTERGLCIKLRTYPRWKNIKGKDIKLPGIIVNIETRNDVDTLIAFIEDIWANREILRKVATTRTNRWKQKNKR